MYLSAFPAGVMWDGGAAFRYRAAPAIRTVPTGVLPGARPPAPRPPIIVVPRTYTPPPVPKPVQLNPNAGTPVPAGYPTNQLFVNSDGSFWEWSQSQSKWVNVGTPYSTGASATPPAPAPPSPTGASTTPAPGAAAPVSVSVPASSGYQAILDWLEKDSLLASLGFANIPNWVTAGAGVLLGYKVAGESKGRH